MAGLKLSDLSKTDQKRILNNDPDSLEHIQYFPADLSYALGIGEIADMHVDTENDIQIFRLSVIPIQAAKYKTVRAAPVEDTRGTVKRKQTNHVSTGRRSGNKPRTVGDAIIEKAKSWLANKEKPQFMKDLER